MTVTDSLGNTYSHGDDGTYRATAVVAGRANVCVEGDGLMSAAFSIAGSLGATLIATTGTSIMCPLLVRAGDVIEVFPIRATAPPPPAAP